MYFESQKVFNRNQFVLLILFKSLLIIIRRASFNLNRMQMMLNSM